MTQKPRSIYARSFSARRQEAACETQCRNITHIRSGIFDEEKEEEEEEKPRDRFRKLSFQA